MKLIVESKYGYHFGNTDTKAEQSSKYTTTRGTGHFGTGTYFVSNTDNVDFGYKNRDVWKIALDKYNLYKPKDFDDGIELHSDLREMNNIVEKNYKYSKQDLKDLLSRSIKKYKDPYESIVRFVKVFKSHTTNYDDFIHNVRNKNWGYVSNYVETLMNNLSKEYDRCYALFMRLSKRFNILGSSIQNIVDKSVKESINNTDSISTLFMKNIGYDGIDVTDIKGLDNFEYGSVVYNLKNGTYSKNK